jgi:ribose transport system substrate-binding protein
MKRNPPVVTAAAVGVLLALTGCGSSSQASGEESAAEGGGSSGQPRIALVAKVSNNPYWQAVNKGAQAAGKDLGAQISFTGPDTESQVDKQVDQLQSALDKKPSAIGIAALDEQAVLPVLETARSENIPVVAFDAKLTSDLPVTTVATDSTAAGAEAAKHMIEVAGATGEIAVIAHSQTSSNGIARRDGFLDHLKRNAPGLKVVDVQYCDSDQAKAANQAAAILEAHPKLIGIYGTNEQSILGAASEVQSSGKKITLIGFDSGSAQIDYITKNVIAGSITQDPYQMGYQTVAKAVDALKGKSVEKDVDSGFHWYTAKNLQDVEIARSLYK